MRAAPFPTSTMGPCSVNDRAGGRGHGEMRSAGGGGRPPCLPTATLHPQGQPRWGVVVGSRAVPLKSSCIEQCTLPRAQLLSPGTRSLCGKKSPSRPGVKAEPSVRNRKRVSPPPAPARWLGQGAQIRFLGRRSGSPTGTAGPPLSGFVWFFIATGLSRQEGVRNRTCLLLWVPFFIL